jgi:MATE family multidrug resistance protein
MGLNGPKEYCAPWIEAKSLLNLALPTAVIQLGFTVPTFLTASYVGRNFGSVYLDGYTLANLTGNLFTLSLLSGLYSAADTLSPQAFGAGNYREVGLYAIRGFLGSMIILIPVNVVLLIWMQPILEAVGQHAEASKHAWHFYLIYAFALPFYALYMVTWKFLSAQNVMMPLMVAAFLSCIVVLPLALQVFTSWFGFCGAALAILVYQSFQACFLLFYLWYWQPHDPRTWPGIRAWRDALEWKSFSSYMILGIGGMLASLEWVYWEALALVVGTLGVIPLSVHTIPTQVITVAFMVSLGVGIALAVRLGATLPRNVLRAKELALACLVLGTILFSGVTVLLYRYRELVFHIFTEEPEVLDGSEEIWGKVCFYFWNLSIFGIIMGIATGLGMQWTLGIVTIVFLWVFGLPASYYGAVVLEGGINAAWEWTWPPYFGINLVMLIAFVLKDWDAVAASIRLREAVVNPLLDGDLETLKLQHSVEDYGAVQYPNASTKSPDKM